jgi:anti-sigma B factor antagonist
MNNNEIVPGFDEEKNDSLKIRLQKIAVECVVVYCTGYIDTYNSAYFTGRISMIIAAGFSRIVFNLAGVIYISSTGIGSFTTFLKALRPRGGDMVLLQVQPRVFEVFQLLGFAQFFNVKENLEQAVAFLESSGTLAGASPFPRVFACPICEKKLKASRAGRFRCSECKTILAVDDGARVLLG